MKSWVGTLLLIIIGLSIWKANNGDVGLMVDSVWAILNKGADIVTGLWNKFMSVSA